MTQLVIPPGLRCDDPEALGSPFWADGRNVRWVADGLPETIGLTYRVGLGETGPAWVAAHSPYRAAVRVGQSPAAASAGSWLFGSTNRLLAATNVVTAFRAYDVTPLTGFTAAAEPVLDLARTPVPAPIWNFSGLGSVVFANMPTTLFGGAGAPFYVWNANTPATPFAPVSITGLTAAVSVVATDDQHVVLFGATPQAGGASALCIRWSDQGAYALDANWTAVDTNAAGDLPPVQHGSRIIRGAGTGLGIVFWTDTAFYRLRQLRDGQYYFRPEPVATDVGLMGPAAWAEAGGRVWWLGDDLSVWAWNGGGVPLRISCPVASCTFDLLDPDKASYVVAFANPEHGEVGWIIERGLGFSDRVAVVYQYELDAWSIWTVDYPARTARSGSMPPLSVDEGLSDGASMGALGAFLAHDMLPPAGGLLRHSLTLGGTTAVVASPRRGWFLETSRFAMADGPRAGRQRGLIDRVLIPRKLRRAPADNRTDDGFVLQVSGWEELDGREAVSRTVCRGPGWVDEPLVEGRVHALRMSADADPEVRRFGRIMLAGRARRDG